ncbi:uncharacterized protein LOC121402018 isoform X1 [Xenopus laevis]|uniref:Uncharacterized protein LOC121402018 isoform X1 n=1 Tax=Xenopus laevis TaxID=8355 RepID=A0A8J1MQC9_XENLA|nr:uncharacterized protein LOC121402018 isoform X1 [Xenopus laevis]
MGTKRGGIRVFSRIQDGTQKRFFHKVCGQGDRVKQRNSPGVLEAVVRVKGNRVGLSSRKTHRFLFETFFSKKGIRRIKTGAGYEKTEQIPASKKIQDGILNVNHASHFKRRLADEHRFKRCVFSCSNRTDAQKVSKIRNRRCACSIQVSSVWSSPIPEGVYKDIGYSHSGIKKGGLGGVSLPRRHPGGSKIKGRSRDSDCQSKGIFARSRLDSKPGKEQFNSRSDPTIFRGFVSNRQKFSQSSLGASSKGGRLDKRFQEKKDSVRASLSESAGIHVGNYTDSEMGKMALKTLTDVSSKKCKAASSTFTEEAVRTTGGKEDPVMVVQTEESGKRNAVGRTRVGDINHRCVKHGMGSPHRRRSGSGHLERRKCAVKSTGVESDKRSPHIFFTPTERKTSKGYVGQYHSSSLFSKAGGHQKRVLAKGSRTTISVGRRLARRVDRGPPSREGKLEGRLPQSDNVGPRGMEPARLDFRRHSEKVGASRDRCDGIPTKPEVSPVLFKVSLQRGRGGGRPESKLVTRQNLCVSTMPVNLESLEKNKERQSRSHCGNPFLAQKAMVSSSSKAGHREAHADSELSRLADAEINPDPKAQSSSLDGLAVERGKLTQLFQKEEVIDFLLKSRKPSTSQQYYRVWEKFVEFATERKEDPLSPSAPMLVEFLFSGYKKRLHCSTLRGQVSAISALTGKNWAERPLVKRFFNALVRVRPTKRSCLPPWDLPFVLKTLSESPFEPLEKASVWNMTLKVILLVAVTSACRVGELAALSVSEPHTVIFEDRVVLKPAFGFLPKVMSKFHMDLEVILPAFFPDPRSAEEKMWHTLDLVRAVKIYMERTKAWRRSEHLFIIPNGYRKGQAPTKRTISSWIVAAIAKAYNVAGRGVPKGLKAHSTRALASSWAAQARESPESICKSARWSSLNTFVKHYKLDVLSSQEAKFGRKVLQSVMSSTN